jgi:hypothetical protein
LAWGLLHWCTYVACGHPNGSSAPHAHTRTRTHAHTHTRGHHAVPPRYIKHYFTTRGREWAFLKGKPPELLEELAKVGLLVEHCADESVFLPKVGGRHVHGGVGDAAGLWGCVLGVCIALALRNIPPCTTTLSQPQLALLRHAVV